MKTPLSNFCHWEKTSPEDIYFRQPIDGKWNEFSFKKSGDEIRKIAAELKAQLPPKSNVAILSKNCAHWIMADLAIWMAGHVSVPLYANSSAASIKQILEHSESKAIFVGKLDDYADQKKGIPDHIIKISISLFGISEG